MGTLRSRQHFVPIVVALLSAAATMVNGAANNLVYDVSTLDTFNAWDGTTFIVPVTGTYQINLSGQFASTGTVTAIDIFFDATIGGSANVIRRFGNRLTYSTAITPVSYSAGATAMPLTATQAFVFRATPTFTGATAVTHTGTYASLTISRLM